MANNSAQSPFWPADDDEGERSPTPQTRGDSTDFLTRLDSAVVLAQDDEATKTEPSLGPNPGNARRSPGAGAAPISLDESDAVLELDLPPSPPPEPEILAAEPAAEIAGPSVGDSSTPVDHRAGSGLRDELAKAWQERLWVRASVGLILGMFVAIWPASRAAQRVIDTRIAAAMDELSEALARPQAVADGSIASPALIEASIVELTGQMWGRYVLLWVAISLLTGGIVSFCRRRPTGGAGESWA